MAEEKKSFIKLRKQSKKEENNAEPGQLSEKEEQPEEEPEAEKTESVAEDLDDTSSMQPSREEPEIVAASRKPVSDKKTRTHKNTPSNKVGMEEDTQPQFEISIPAILVFAGNLLVFVTAFLRNADILRTYLFIFGAAQVLIGAVLWFMRER